jgi:hypothetical protein
MRKTIAFALALATAAATGASAEDVDLDELRARVAKYQDVEVALADGYIDPDNHCVSAEGEGLPPELGAMGIHFIHPALLQVTATEPRVDGASTYVD